MPFVVKLVFFPLYPALSKGDTVYNNPRTTSANAFALNPDSADKPKTLKSVLLRDICRHRGIKNITTGDTSAMRLFLYYKKFNIKEAA